jgi:hypothetical protein
MAGHGLAAVIDQDGIVVARPLVLGVAVGLGQHRPVGEELEAVGVGIVVGHVDVVHLAAGAVEVQFVAAEGPALEHRRGAVVPALTDVEDAQVVEEIPGRNLLDAPGLQVARVPHDAHPRPRIRGPVQIELAVDHRQFV